MHASDPSVQRLIRLPQVANYWGQGAGEGFWKGSLVTVHYQCPVHIICGTCFCRMRSFVGKGVLLGGVRWGAVL